MNGKISGGRRVNQNNRRTKIMTEEDTPKRKLYEAIIRNALHPELSSLWNPTDSHSLIGPKQSADYVTKRALAGTKTLRLLQDETKRSIRESMKDVSGVPVIQTREDIETLKDKILTVRDATFSSDALPSAAMSGKPTLWPFVDFLQHAGNAIEFYKGEGSASEGSCQELRSFSQGLLDVVVKERKNIASVYANIIGGINVAFNVNLPDEPAPEEPETIVSPQTELQRVEGELEALRIQLARTNKELEFTRVKLRDEQNTSKRVAQWYGTLVQSLYTSAKHIRETLRSDDFKSDRVILESMGIITEDGKYAEGDETPMDVQESSRPIQELRLERYESKDDFVASVLRMARSETGPSKADPTSSYATFFSDQGALLSSIAQDRAHLNDSTRNIYVQISSERDELEAMRNNTQTYMEHFESIIPTGLVYESYEMIGLRKIIAFPSDQPDPADVKSFGESDAYGILVRSFGIMWETTFRPIANILVQLSARPETDPLSIAVLGGAFNGALNKFMPFMKRIQLSTKESLEREKTEALLTSVTKLLNEWNATLKTSYENKSPPGKRELFPERTTIVVDNPDETAYKLYTDPFGSLQQVRVTFGRRTGLEGTSSDIRGNDFNAIKDALTRLQQAMDLSLVKGSSEKGRKISSSCDKTIQNAYRGNWADVFGQSPEGTMQLFACLSEISNILVINLKTFQNEFNALESDKQYLENVNGQLNEENNELKKENKNKTEKINGLEVNFQKCQDESNRLNMDNADLTKQVNVLGQRVDELQKRKREMKKGEGELFSNIEDVSEENNRLKNQIEGLHKEIVNLNRANTEQNEGLQEFIDNLQLVSQQKNDAEEKNERLKTTISDLESRQSDLNNTVTDFKKLVNELTDEKFVLQTRYDALKNQYDDLNNQYDALNNQYNALRASSTSGTSSDDLIARLDDDLRRIMTEKTSLEADALKKEGEIKLLKQTLNDTEEKNQKLNRTLTDTKAENQELEKHLENQNDDIKTLYEKLQLCAAIIQGIRTASGPIKGVEKEIWQLQNYIDTMGRSQSQNLKTVKKQVTTLSQKITQELNDLRDQLSKTKDELDTSKRKLAICNRKITELRGELNTYKKREREEKAKEEGPSQRKKSKSVTTIPPVPELDLNKPPSTEQIPSPVETEDVEELTGGISTLGFL